MCVIVPNFVKIGRNGLQTSEKASWEKRTQHKVDRSQNGRSNNNSLLNSIHFQVTALGKLLTRMCICHQAV